MCDERSEYRRLLIARPVSRRFAQRRFGEYYRYRREQQIFKDPPPRVIETLATNEMDENHAKELYVDGLPGGIARELAMLKLKAKEVKVKV